MKYCIWSENTDEYDFTDSMKDAIAKAENLMEEAYHGGCERDELEVTIYEAVTRVTGDVAIKFITENIRKEDVEKEILAKVVDNRPTGSH